jgi:hypothetical protein
MPAYTSLAKAHACKVCGSAWQEVVAVVVYTHPQDAKEALGVDAHLVMCFLKHLSQESAWQTLDQVGREAGVAPCVMRPRLCFTSEA